MNVFSNMWSEMYRERILDPPVNDGLSGATVTDIVKFFVLFSRVRRRKNRCISQHLRSVVKAALLRLLTWLSDLVDRYVIRTYTICADAAVQCPSPQSLRHQCKSGRTYTIVSDGAKWDLMEKAKDSRANYRQALSLRSDDPSLGGNEQEGDRWASTRNFMYHERVTQLFRQIMHYCIAADPGTHSYKEIMPGILYSWELDMASFLPWQRVVAAQGGLLYGDTEIDEDVMPYFEERKLDKIATFRQLQGPIKFNQTYSVLGRGVDLPESVFLQIQDMRT